MQQLTQKVAFVTGGSRGIGAAITEKLAEEGALVVFTYVNGHQKADALIEKLRNKGLKAVAIKADNAISGSVTATLQEAIRLFGQLDILVNSAGIYIGKLFEEHTLEDYEVTMNINTRAVFEACLFAAREMKPNGRIITIGSNMAERVGGPQGTLYAMSKSALTGLTKGLARDLGPKGITVNLVQPGSVNTDMNPENSSHANMQREQMAIKKYGHPTHIADFVSYLASPASNYTTGGIFTIDGGTCS